MSAIKPSLFTIGQFASLHHINKKTLMWYDEIGLFKPAYIKDNGYRYYTYHQSSTLETILMLRELSVSTQEIKEYLENKSPSSLHKLLDEKIKEVNQTIHHLTNIKKAMKVQKQEIENLLDINLNEIEIIEKEEQSYIMIQTKPNTSLEKEVEMLIKETQKNQNNRLYNTHYGSIISIENIQAHHFDQYEAIFIETNQSTSQKNIHVRPKGKYLRAYCKGNWDLLPLKYIEILDYANKNNILLKDAAFETGINETTINSMNDYITMIEIPIITCP